MFMNGEVRFVIEETINHMGGIAGGGTDHFDTIGTILIGKMRIKADTRFCAIAQVYLCHRTAPAADLEALSIRRGSRAIAPGGGKGMVVVIVDHFCQRLGVRLVAHVPIEHPGQTGKGHPIAGFCHPDQPHIQGFGE